MENLYIYIIYIYIYFRRNKVYASWQLDKASISVNRGSHFQVHFVWQVWDGQLSPAFKSIRLKAFGGWKFDRGTTKLHARILRGKGAQKKKPNMFTAGSSTSATFVLPVRHGTGVALQKRVWTFPKTLNRTELQMRRHGNNEEGKGAAQKGIETRGCRYFMWSMMTKLKHVQQAAADLTIPTE